MADDLPQDVPVTPDTGGDKGDAVSETKALVLDRLAKSNDDATSFIEERISQESEEQTGEVDASAGRAQRIKEALEAARRDTAEAKGNGLDDQLQDAQQQWEQQQAQEQWQAQQAEKLLNDTRNEATFQAHASMLKEANPQIWQTITDTLGTFDTLAQSDEQIDALKRGLTADARQGMEMAWRLSQTSYNPDGSVQMTPADKMAHLASLSPQELASTLEQARLYTQIEGQVSRQYAQRYAHQPKRFTSAPPPMKHPSGGASPPKDVASLARKDNAGDYIKARMAQEKRAEER